VTLADTPNDWPNPPPMSTLHGLLLFVGTPLLAIVVISLLVMAPSLAKGPRYRPGRQWDARPEQFGALPGRSTEPGRELSSGAEPGRELSSGPAVSNREQATGGPRDRRDTTNEDTTGGASVTW
jgi:hypothetical protein